MHTHSRMAYSPSAISGLVAAVHRLSLSLFSPPTARTLSAGLVRCDAREYHPRAGCWCVFSVLHPLPELTNLLDTAKGLITTALAVTLFRLGIRVHDKRWGWDDFWAAVSIVTSSFVLTGTCISLTPKGKLHTISLQISC